MANVEVGTKKCRRVAHEINHGDQTQFRQLQKYKMRMGAVNQMSDSSDLTIMRIIGSTERRF